MGTTENLGEQQSGGMVQWLGQNMQNHQDDIRESGNFFFFFGWMIYNFYTSDMIRSCGWYCP